MNAQTNYCSNNLLILNVKQLQKCEHLLHLYFKGTLEWPG